MRRLSEENKLLLADLSRVGSVSAKLIARVCRCSVNCVRQYQMKLRLVKRRPLDHLALQEIDSLLAAGVGVGRVAKMTSVSEKKVAARKKELAQNAQASSSNTTAALVKGLSLALGSGTMPPDDVLLKNLVADFELHAREAIARLRVTRTSEPSTVH